MKVNRIRDFLKNTIEERGISARNLALGAGIPESSLKNIMQGKVKRPRQGTIEAIARHLDVPISVITGNEHYYKEITAVANNSRTNKAAKSDYLQELELFSQAFNKIIQHMLENNIPASSKQVFDLTNDLYNYMLSLKQEQKTDPRIDDIMVPWVIKTYMKYRDK